MQVYMSDKSENQSLQSTWKILKPRSLFTRIYITNREEKTIAASFYADINQFYQ